MSMQRVTAIATCNTLEKLRRVLCITHHTDQAGSIIAIEKEGVETAEKGTKSPSSLEVADCCQRQVDRAEEQVGDGKADHEDRRGLRAQLLVPHQADHRDQVPRNTQGGEEVL